MRACVCVSCVVSLCDCVRLRARVGGARGAHAHTGASAPKGTSGYVHGYGYRTCSAPLAPGALRAGGGVRGAGLETTQIVT